MALGADRAKLTAGVVGSSMKFALLGAAAGAGVVLLGARSLSAVLPSFVRPDPWMLAGNVAILIAVAALAAWEPARRAARVDPLIALRTE